LIETMIACVLLTVGIGSVATTAISCMNLQLTTADYDRAHNVCRDVIEKLRSDPTTQFQTYKAAPTFRSGDLQVTLSFPQALLFPRARLGESLGQSVPVTARFRDLDNDGQVDFNAAGTDIVSPIPVQVTVTRGRFRMTTSALVMQR